MNDRKEIKTAAIFKYHDLSHFEIKNDEEAKNFLNVHFLYKKVHSSTENKLLSAD